ncbi:hypothetical protein LG299_12555 [Microbacterium lacus]|uniref:hypothetical protein n=1 Tax=Microbacterium lacus TaxID=415217 RepID=UPI003850D2FC
MTEYLGLSAMDPTLGPALLRAQGDAWSRLAAVTTKGLAAGFPPASIRYWARERGGPEVAALAASYAGFSDLVRRVRKHVATNTDPGVALRRASAVLLAPPEGLIAARPASAALALVALAAARQDGVVGGQVALSAGSAAVILGVTPETARRHLDLLTDANVLRARRADGAPTRYALALPKRQAAKAWLDDPRVTAMVDEILAGERHSWLAAFLAPEVSYGSSLLPADVWLLMIESHGVDPATIGLDGRNLRRAQARLRAIGATDLESLWTALTDLATAPDASGTTPLQRRQAAQTAYEVKREARLAELAVRRTAMRDAWTAVRTLIAKPPRGLGYPPSTETRLEAWVDRAQAHLAKTSGLDPSAVRTALAVVLTSALNQNRDAGTHVARVIVPEVPVSAPTPRM